jgi:DNA-binding IclR family transcriptional regulator
MSSLSRVLAILNLFTEDQPTWHSDEIMAARNYARPTAYRYIRELVSAGYLQKVAAGRYALGARIIELDYLVRNSDPLLLAAMPIMDELARQTGLDVVLTAMFRDRVIDIHRVHVDAAVRLAYGRGRPRPLFRGAAPKIILAHLPRLQAAKLYKTHAAEIDACGLGGAWPAFREHLIAWRKSGIYVSRGEMEPGAYAMAAPIFNPQREVAALALVGVPERFDAAAVVQRGPTLLEACRRIEKAIAGPAMRPAGARPAPWPPSSTATPR